MTFRSSLLPAYACAAAALIFVVGPPTILRIVMITAISTVVSVIFIASVTSAICVAARNGHAFAQTCAMRMMTLLPPPLDVMAFAVFHFRQMMPMVVVMLGMEEDEGRDGRDGRGNDVDDGRDGSIDVANLVHDLVHASEMDVIMDDIDSIDGLDCAICLDDLRKVEVGMWPVHVSPHDVIRVVVRQARTFGCRVCRQRVHLACMLQCVIIAGRQQQGRHRCPLCNAPLFLLRSPKV